MIFLDTNLFYRHFVAAQTPAEKREQSIATALFEAVERGELEVTTSEVVIHEFCRLMTGLSLYNENAVDFLAAFASILNLHHFKLPPGDKAVYLRAFEILTARPSLGFPDSVIAARAEKLDIPLATFDKRLARLPFLKKWDPVEA
jgi:predicted nucleic acid-binding protein